MAKLPSVALTDPSVDTETANPKRQGRGALLLLLVLSALAITAAIFWVQQPKILDEIVNASSPDGNYSAQASTWRKMRMFKSNALFYKLSVERVGPNSRENWTARTPIHETLTNNSDLRPESIAFSEHGSIKWSDDSTRVSFQVHGTDIAVYDVDSGERDLKSHENNTPATSEEVFFMSPK